MRIVLIGQVNAGKSSLLECTGAGEPVRGRGRCRPPRGRRNIGSSWQAVRPCRWSTCRASASAADRAEFLEQAERADLVVWVASATQPARDPDRQGLDAVRAWAAAQLARRVPPIVLALTHIDELRPAAEWTPPYDVAAPAGPKARSIRAAIDSVAQALDLPVDAIVPVAMPSRPRALQHRRSLGAHRGSSSTRPSWCSSIAFASAGKD